MMGNLITSFTRHRVTANVLTLVFLLSGAFALTRLTVRFFPKFETNTIVTTVVMAGATAVDIEESVVVPLENALRSVPSFTDIYSYARENSGTVILEFPDTVDLNKALEDVKAEVEQAKLPGAAESPSSFIAEFPEPIMKLTLIGADRSELRLLARRLESSLNALNAGKLSVTGIPEEEISVLVSRPSLVELGLTLRQIGAAVGAQNRNASVGSIGGLGNERSLRAAAERSDLRSLAVIPVTAAPDGAVVSLGDIARFERGPKPDQVETEFNGRHSVVFSLINTENQDILKAAGRINEWLAKTRAQLPPSVELVAHEQEWQAVKSRLTLLLENGAMGMLLVIAVLFLFLSGPVALWVAAAIPVAMMATLFVFYLFGGSINMISMFALIMAVGIIVDDSIVVGENAQFRLNRGEPPMRAVISAAKQMFVPVFASSFTTVSAFMPLFLVSGPIGAIVFDIPLIIVCILIAALFECFLILPGHLYQSFAKRRRTVPSRVRTKLDSAFDVFREKYFRPLARAAVANSFATVCACAMLMALAVSLLANGYVNYRFFPGAEGNKLFGSVKFSSGTPRATVTMYVNEMIEQIGATDAAFGEDKLVRHISALIGEGGENTADTDERAQIRVELVPAESRTVTVDQFAKAWRERLRLRPGIERLDVRGESSGPPGRDIELQLSAATAAQSKQFSQLVQNALAAIPGVSSVSDDTPYGKEEIIFALTPLGRSLNLDVANVAAQLGDALDGFKVQTFTEGVDEVELRVKLDGLDADVIGSMLILLPSGEHAPLSDLVTWRTEQGFETILHRFGSPAVVVSGDLDPNAKTTVGAVLAELEQGVLRELSSQHGINYTFVGKNKDEQQTAKEMMTGLILAVALIYIILTWVFNSWTLPLPVMLTMPLGVVGTIYGHWIMGISMSILSFFGMFTLMGIIVNDSIVLVRCFQDLREKTDDPARYDEFIVEAACQRLRAVLLTSLTTIGGLMPLLFETSLQAQFLIPMAVSICFGLGFATVLILLFTPACLSLHGSFSRLFSRLFSRRKTRSPAYGVARLESGN